MTNTIPSWMSDASYEQFKKSALPNESPRDAYTRLAKGDNKLFDYLWKGWICPSTPVLANYNTDRGLPISCFSSTAEDSLDGIMDTASELAQLTKNGGGTAVNLSYIRAKGTEIAGNGTSNGVIGWCKIYDTIIDKVRQGNVRRGAVAFYLDVYHNDIFDFLRIRRPEGDPRNQCMDSNIAISVPDKFMERLIEGHTYEREVWQLILKERLEMGEPYIFFRDNANRNLHFPDFPQYEVSASNLCSEIMLHSDNDHTFVCCLSSLNLTKYDEWKDTDVVDIAIRFLDDVMEEFLIKAKQKTGMEKAVRFAEKSRALGLGVLGWHTLCQKKMISIESREAAQLNYKIFNKLCGQAYNTSGLLAKEKETPEWLMSLNRRNSHLLAIAPTFTNSIISGFVSEGINPISSNAYLHRSSKKSFLKYNQELMDLNILTEEHWKTVENNRGSVQSLDIDPHIKEVFKTAKEINQMSLIDLAVTRQLFIDQGQSLNLYCYYDVPKNIFNQWHIEAWKKGLKSLYYVRSSAMLQGDTVNYSTACSACEG